MCFFPSLPLFALLYVRHFYIYPPALLSQLLIAMYVMLCSVVIGISVLATQAYIFISVIVFISSFMYLTYAPFFSPLFSRVRPVAEFNILLSL